VVADLRIPLHSNNSSSTTAVDTMVRQTVTCTAYLRFDVLIRRRTATNTLSISTLQHTATSARTHLTIEKVTKKTCVPG
jgi:hypothetical protein